MINLKLNKKEVTDLFDDIIKFLSLAIIIHILLFAIDDYGDLFSEFALKIFLYITIAIVIYHLIIKKIANKLLRNK